MANSHLNRTYGSAGNQRTFTISVWLKRGNTGSNGNIFTYQDPSGTARSEFAFNNSGLKIVFNPTGSSWSSDMFIRGSGSDNYLFRDTSAWYHIVLAVDTTQSTEANRLKAYVNGVQYTMSAYPSLNYDTGYNQAYEHSVGSYINAGASDFFDGYMSHFAVVDGQQLAPTVFGETDSTSGIWKFKSPSGVTWGTNGVHLKFENSGNLGLDSSGQTNNFTTNGNLKQALDTPSNVHNTGNPLYVWNYSLSHSNGNLSFAGSQNQWQGAATNLAISKGKWYYEAKFTSATDIGNWGVGFMGREDFNLTNATRNFVGFYNYDGGEIWVADASNSTPTTADYGTFANGDIIGIALDYDNEYISVYKNGSAIVTNFDYGAVGTSSTVKGGKFISPVFFNYGSGAISANFGNGFFGTTAITSAGSNGNGSLFEYNVPSGYYALNTKNINTYG
jgi:hypothetical protein